MTGAVALIFSDGIVGDDNGSGTRVKDAGTKGIPGCLVAEMAVDDDDTGKTLLHYGRSIDDGRHTHAIAGGVADALSDYALSR